MKNDISEKNETPELAAAIASARKFLQSGDYDKVMNFRVQHERTPSPELAEILAQACFAQGEALADTAQSLKKRRDPSRWNSAEEKFIVSLSFDPNRCQTYLHL